MRSVFLGYCCGPALLRASNRMRDPYGPRVAAQSTGRPSRKICPDVTKVVPSGISGLLRTLRVYGQRSIDCREPSRWP